MKKTIQTARYLFTGFARSTAIGFLVILGNLAMVDLIYQLTDRNNPTHVVVSLTTPFEFTGGVFVFIISLVLYIPNFKVALANGISRKTFFLANLPMEVMVAATLSILNLVTASVHYHYWPVNFISQLFFPQMGWADLLFLQFTLFFLMILLGGVITLAYYRSAVPAKRAISLAPFILYGLVRVINAQSGGATYTAIGKFLHNSLATPISASFSFMVCSIILGCISYLLLRRAPLKD
jgi:hypothetical protein